MKRISVLALAFAYASAGAQTQKRPMTFPDIMELKNVAGVAISPADPSTSTKGTIAFTAFGGSGAFTWALASSLSGGTIDAGTGNYVAGTTGNVVDVVKVTDSLGIARSPS